MATIKVKRSAVAGRVPATTDLELGEIAINTYDGVAYIKKSVSGTDSVVQIGSANLSQNLQNRYQYIASASQTTFAATYLAPYVDVYLNGIRLIAGVDYTATSGTTVVLTSGASLNNTIDIVAYTSYTANANFADLASVHVTTALGYTPENPANKGVANGYASLNSSGQIPSVQLPSFVDDVVEYANLAALPATGETGKIYVTQDTNKTYRWSGSAYTEIASSPGSTDAVTEGSSNLYFTNARARNALSATQNLTYSSSTGVFTGPDLSGYLTSATAANVYAPLANPSFTGDIATAGQIILNNNNYIGFKNNIGFASCSIFQDTSNDLWLYNGGATNTRFYTSATERVRITADGIVGIGTNSPDTSTRLTVAGAMTLTGQNTGHGASRLKLGQDSNAISQIRFYGANASTAGILQFTGSSSDGNVGGERMRIDASGNVGIGTNNPGRKLHVVGGAIKCGDNSGADRWSSDSWSRHIEIDSTNYGGGGIVWLKQNTNASRAILANNGNFYIARSTADDNSAAPTYDFTILASGAVGFNGANYGTTGQVLTSQGSGAAPIWAAAGGGSSQWTTSGTQIYYNTGNVGVGTASPDTYTDGGKNLTILSSTAGTRAQLAIVGNQNTADEILGRINITNTNSTNTAYRVAMIDGIRGTDNNSAYLTFSTANTAGPGERMRIDQVGRVYTGPYRSTTDAQFSATVLNSNSNGIVVGVRGAIVADVYPGVANAAAGYFTNNSFGTRYGVYGTTAGVSGYGSNHGGYFVSGGDPTSECYGVYGETTQTDTNGGGVSSAVYAYAKSNQGVNDNGYAIGLYCRTNNYFRNQGILVKSDYTGSATQTAIRFNRNGSDVGSITNTTTATAYNTSSDYRLKNSVAPMTGALAKVALLKPVTYKWNSNGNDGEGFLAHELAEVCPHAVTGNKDEVKIEEYVIEPEEFDVKITPAEFDADGNEVTPLKDEKIITKPAVMGSREVPVYQSIDTSFLVATLTAAIQELKAEFDAYRASHP